MIQLSPHVDPPACEERRQTGSKLRHAKKNRAYYDPNTGWSNYDMDQRVSVTAGPKLNNPHLADGLDIYDGMVTNAAVTEAPASSVRVQQALKR
jgi:hypothetical protein